MSCNHRHKQVNANGQSIHRSCNDQWHSKRLSQNILSNRLPVHPSIYSSIHPSIHLFIQQPVTFVHPFTHPQIHPLTYLPIYMPVRPMSMPSHKMPFITTLTYLSTLIILPAYESIYTSSTLLQTNPSSPTVSIRSSHCSLSTRLSIKF